MKGSPAEIFVKKRRGLIYKSLADKAAKLFAYYRTCISFVNRIILNYTYMKDNSRFVVLISIFLFATICVFSNEGKDTVYVATDNIKLRESIGTDHVIVKVDKKPEFRGGMKEIDKFVEKNLRYPNVGTDSLTSKTVSFKFIVTEQGEIKDITILKGLTSEYDAEAMRIVSSFPKMTPGIKDGKAVATQFFYRLRFMKIKLQEKYADKMPSFPGGDKALVTYIWENLKYPEDAQMRKLDGRVIVRFSVSKTGKLGNIEIAKRADFHDFNVNAYELVKGMLDWEPGLFEGEPESATFILPIVYRLKKPDAPKSTFRSSRDARPYGDKRGR